MGYKMDVTGPCRIHSLNGGMAEATIIAKTGDNEFLAKYRDVICTAIYNPFVGCYFVDDKYGIVPEEQAGKLLAAIR